MSPTQWYFSGTLRSSPATNSSCRLWLCRSQCRNSTALPTVADSSSVRTCSGSRPERQFPDDAAFGIGEAVELVHHHGADVAEVEGAAKGSAGKGTVA